MANTKFTIFFTGDIHGRDRESAKLFSIYKRERKKAEAEGRICLFFDSGDSSDRCVDYCSLTHCRAYSHILNEFDYDAQTVGNDIGLVYGTEALESALKEINHPVLGANFRNGKDPLLQGLKEHTIIEKSGIRIGIFGLTNPWGKAYEAYGYKFPDAAECTSQQVQKLKDEGVQIIIFLSHMGIIDDMELSFHQPDINFVVGGHSHSLTPGGVFNHRGTVFHYSGSYAEHLGRIDFDFDRQENRVLNAKASLSSNSENEIPAEEIIKAISRAREDSNKIGKKIIGTTEDYLSLEYQKECPIGILAADALKHYWGTELAIVAGGNLNGAINQGEITLADLNRACFSTANPCLSHMSGKSLRICLENGLRDKLRNFYHHGLRGAPIGIPQISGLTIEADLSEPEGKRIKNITLSGIPIDEKKIYSIAHTDLENHKTLGYFPDSGHTLKEVQSDIFLKDVLVEYLVHFPQVQLNKTRRWQFS